MPITPELLLFIPTFFLVSISPGLCMTLALSLGIQVGWKRTLWMMLGELTGVVLIASSAVLGLSTILLQYPTAFNLLKIAGAVYLIHSGFKLCIKSQTDINKIYQADHLTPQKLIIQGFITAVANPKGWVFMLAFLPPFINSTTAMLPQFVAIIVAITIIEFISLNIYTLGGSYLNTHLNNNENVGILNKITGTLLMLVGVWLAIS